MDILTEALKLLKEEQEEDKRIFDNIIFYDFFENDTPQDIIDMYSNDLHRRGIVSIRREDFEPETAVLTFIDNNGAEYQGELNYKDLWIEDEEVPLNSITENLNLVEEEALIQSDSQEAFNHNLKLLLDSGKPRKQALAIAYSIQRKNKINRTVYYWANEASGESGFALFHPEFNKWILYSNFAGVDGVYDTEDAVKRDLAAAEAETYAEEGEDEDPNDPVFHWGSQIVSEEDFQEYLTELEDDRDVILNW